MMTSKKSILLILFFSVVVSASAQLSMKKVDDGIVITEHGEDVLLYRTAQQNMGGFCSRCNYIHPLYGLNGGVLTEDAPSDHPYHRGIFWAWRQILINGEKVADQWELDHFSNEILEFELMKRQNGNIVLKNEVNWLSDRWKKLGKEEPFVSEFTKMEIWPASGNVRRIDFQINLKALVKGVQIGGSDDEKGYGGFSVRMVLPDDVVFTGPNGAVEPMNEAVSSPGYINVSGNIDNDKSGGIVIVDHPDNPGYPQSWILRQKNSMQNAAWPGRQPVDLSTEEPLVLKYTLFIYSGKLNARKIKSLINSM
ncbi:DUF6807 family protein [Maribellus sediminis]|uniref:DUF6807 family protein n=1 Tax=Maribellus sediminis TaxID=2696285 RepID=UPI001431EB7F|nr:DUF6807 family protein [Maribellus sediminis]